MEKNLSLSASQNFSILVSNAVQNLVAAANKPVALLAKYYSDCLGKNISIRQTWLLLNAQAAFFMSVFPVSAPVLARLVCLCWLLHALKLCKDSL